MNAILLYHYNSIHLLNVYPDRCLAILPRGADDYFEMIAGIGRTFWGLQRDVWSDLHAWIAVVITAIIIIHVAIHWRWFLRLTLGEKQKEME